MYSDLFLIFYVGRTCLNKIIVVMIREQHDIVSTQQNEGYTVGTHDGLIPQADCSYFTVPSHDVRSAPFLSMHARRVWIASSLIIIDTSRVFPSLRRNAAPNPLLLLPHHFFPTVPTNRA